MQGHACKHTGTEEMSEKEALQSRANPGKHFQPNCLLDTVGIWPNH